MRDAIAELQPGQDAQRDTLPTTTAAATDWSGWDRWLRGHLNIELANLHRALGQLLAAERRKFESKTRELELEIAKLSGAVDVLRGAQPPPVPKFPSVKAWSEGTVYHAGDIVALAGGGCYQATRDTARAPGATDWICLAESGETIIGPSGRSLTIRGTHDANATYERRARLNAHEAMFRAQLEVALERRLREAEEKIERKMRAVEEEIERKRRAAEAVEQAAVSAPPYRAGPERGQNGGMDGPGSLAGSVDEDELGSASRDGFR